MINAIFILYFFHYNTKSGRTRIAAALRRSFYQ
ncbi:hypothetical protein B23_2385 [Geobacillus thermoleovorans B23]|nr:hypothetical protein B23_2385 [Geobacillus thermoleovorans B23]